jgi:hypothetical protein
MLHEHLVDVHEAVGPRAGVGDLLALLDLGGRIGDLDPGRELDAQLAGLGLVEPEERVIGVAGRDDRVLSEQWLRERVGVGVVLLPAG